MAKAKKASPKKAVAGKKASAATRSTKAAAGKPMTKSQLLTSLSEKTELSKKEVGDLLDALESLAAEQLQNGPGVFVIPNLVKIKKQETKAVPAGERPVPGQKGVTKWYEAKPASVKPKVQALKRLKDIVRGE